MMLANHNHHNNNDEEVLGAPQVFFFPPSFSPFPFPSSSYSSSSCKMRHVRATSPPHIGWKLCETVRPPFPPSVFCCFCFVFFYSPPLTALPTLISLSIFFLSLPLFLFPTNDNFLLPVLLISLCNVCTRVMGKDVVMQDTQCMLRFFFFYYYFPDHCSQTTK